MIYTITLNPSIDRTMHFPQLAIGELNRATRTRSDFSGKGVNVSVALARFGLDSVAMGFMAGAYGRVLVPGLEAMGLQCDFVEVPGETRSNVTVIDTATGVTTKLNEPGPTVTPEDLARRSRRAWARGASRRAMCASCRAPCPPGRPRHLWVGLSPRCSAAAPQRCSIPAAPPWQRLRRSARPRQAERRRGGGPRGAGCGRLPSERQRSRLPGGHPPPRPRRAPVARRTSAVPTPMESRPAPPSPRPSRR